MVPDHADPPHLTPAPAPALRVRGLRLAGFRAYARADVDLDADVVAITGPNGAGKTTLLEAVHLALAGRSFRTAGHDQCIARGAPFARVEVDAVESGRPRRLVAVLERGAPRRHEEDDAPVAAGELASRHAVLAFVPAPLVQAVARADDALTLLRTGDEDGARGAVVHLARALAAAGCESYVSGSVASSCRGLAAAWRSVLLANPR